MVSRARTRAGRYGLDQIEVLTGDMRDLPLEDGTADLCLTYSGLHMIPDPEVALAEMARCLRPGGRILGTMFLAGGRRRQQLIFAIGARTGHAAPSGTTTDLTRWLGQAGFTDIDVSGGDGFVLFKGRLTGAGAPGHQSAGG